MTRPFYSLDHYGKRLAPVIEYIDANLAEPLPLSVLAAKASFSPNHFHQIFRESQGETPQSYVRRCRLDRAAALLHYALGTAIKDIAPLCGFKSVEAFDRAFHAYFGMTPTEWRNGGYANWNKSPASLPAVSPALSKEQVEIKILPSFRAVYKRKVGPYREGEADLWTALADMVAPLGLSTKECFGVGLDDPAVTPSIRCRFDACVRLPELVSPPLHVPVRLIPGGYHAVLPYSGPAGETEGHWLWLLQTWLPQSGFKVGQNAGFEHYLEGMPVPGMHVHSELCLPLAR
jgi:AraC family transcriptional regulator